MENDADFFYVNDEQGTTIEKNDAPLQQGNYYIVAQGSFSINNELILTRAMSQSGTRTRSFRDRVRARDSKCCISGRPAETARIGIFVGFKAAHIFPLAYEGHFNLHNFGQWITIPASDGGAINSVQNGILLRADIHQLFDSFAIAVNPDDDYKVISFLPHSLFVYGTHLDHELLRHPERPVEQLFRWHFRQAVLANMRGAGEPVLEHDFPPGSDMIGEVLRGPRAAEVMEFHLFSRLATDS